MFNLTHTKNEGKGKCCEICFGIERNNEDSDLIQCNNCGFCCHKECYNDKCDCEEEKLMVDWVWLCDRCKYEINNKNSSLECQICHTNVYFILFSLFFTSLEILE